MHSSFLLGGIDFELQLSGGEFAQLGVGFQAPDRRATEHPPVLNADLPGPDMEWEFLSGGLSPAIRRPEFVALAGRPVDPRFEHDLLARLHAYFDRGVNQSHDPALSLRDRLAFRTSHGRRVLVQV